MARLRRPVEREGLRQRVVDRLIAVGLAAVAIAGLMSFAFGPRQAAVSRAACLIGSLGLATCRDELPSFEPVRLGEPRCRFLAELDPALPEVRTETVTLPSGLSLTTSRARSGDVWVQAGPPTATDPPAVLDGEQRRARYPAPGLEVPAHTEWLLPPGADLRQLATALQVRHDQEVRSRSAMALFARLVHPVGGPELPAPTVRYSRLSLDSAPFPVPLETSESVPGKDDHLALDRGRPAMTAYRTTQRELAVIAPIAGEVDGRPVAGVVRWIRDEESRLTGVLIMVVADGSLIKSAPELEKSISVGYVGLPIRTDGERELAERWLSDRAGFGVSTRELFGLAAPKDRLTGWLSRAATVTVLRYRGIASATALGRASEEVRLARRADWPEARLVSVQQVAPRPDGTARTAVDDPGCGW
ncbi:hypothetical protein [Microlunatus sp. GCM10028923]|uniref:hypothetical protein n=1 Tax=Microlunatus sp. GCM10028923 TaxID=3273400 RepID=UPI00360D3675